MRSTRSPSLFLFGPQTTKITPELLGKLGASVAKNQELSFLIDAVAELPSLWLVLQDAYPALSKVSGAEQLMKLKAVITEGTLPEDWKSLGNTFLSPLTVVKQIAEFVRLGQEGDEEASASLKEKYRIKDAQGFCIGFLTAAVISCSRDTEEFKRCVATALRLATCIGAVVDWDQTQAPWAAVAVRWTTKEQQAHLEKTLADYADAYIACVTDRNSRTVTVPSDALDAFTKRICEGGLFIQPVGLYGRYHHPVHAEAVRHIKSLCEKDARFQLPPADSLVLPLRSNGTSELVTEGALHDIALDTVLTERAQWFPTVQACLRSLASNDIDIVPVGTEGVMPRRVLSELASLSSPPASAVAIVGMACRFPQADSLEEFWSLISGGISTVEPLPKTRFDPAAGWRDPKGPFWGNFLRDPDAFDHKFFGISGREAKSMDPQQRLLLQVAYEAMESAGYCGLDADGEDDVGCYVGVGSVDYEHNVASHDTSAFSAPGTLRAFISGRVSHYFGWKGPSITYDTACSSSAVAIHSACKALQTGECFMALAGGVNVITSPALYQNLAGASFLNPKGASRAFDVDASGYCRGEGAGVVVLKPLGRALADGDSILGILSGSAVNQGANCTPITVPDSGSQSTLYGRALSASGLKPKDISYVEAHGTGTPVGDPIEYESIRRAFGGAQRGSQELVVGSVKDNIGHCEAASGAAGLLKTVLMMQHRLLPKQANFTRLSPQITASAQDHMAILTQTKPWDAKRLAALVNNYGAGGNNAALVVQEAPANVTVDRRQGSTALAEVPIFVAAKTPESLRAYCAALKSFVGRAQHSLAGLAYNLAVKQNRSFEYSWTGTASDVTSLAKQLEAVVADSAGSKKPAQPYPVVLCFGGQSGRTVTLSESLFNGSKILRTHLADCDSIVKSLGLPSLFPQIFQTEPVEDVVSLHSMLFSLQYASAKAWLECGLKVDAMVGHSFGQLTALCVAGSISLADALRLVSERARLIKEHWPAESGVMLSVEGDTAEVDALMKAAPEQSAGFQLEIACYNGPRNFVLAGSNADIEAVEAVAKTEQFAKRLQVGRLKTTHAFHSRFSESILPGLRKVAESITFKTPSMPIETCSKGQAWAEVSAEEIVQHTRTPVYFSEAVERIANRLKSPIWLEAGSASPIMAMTRRVLKEDSGAHVFLPLDLGTSKAYHSLAKTTSELWAAGSKAQFWPFHRSQKSSYAWIDLPPYQFEKNRHWLEYKASPAVQECTSVPTSQVPELLRLVERRGGEAMFTVNPADQAFTLCTRGHAVLGQSLCPASMYLELVLRAASMIAVGSSSVKIPHIQGLDIASPLTLGPSGGTSLLLSQDNTTAGDSWSFSLFSRGQHDAASHTVHASGKVSLSEAAPSGFASLKRLVRSARCEEILNAPAANGLSGNVIYKTFSRVVDYAAYYRGVKKVMARGSESVGVVSVPADQPASLTKGCCDPIAIDNFLQVAGIHVNCLSDTTDDEVYMCTQVAELSFTEQFMSSAAQTRSWTVYSNYEPTGKGTVSNDIFVLDDNSGELVLYLMGVQFRSVLLKSLSRSLSKLNGVGQPSQPKASTSQIEIPTAIETDVFKAVASQKAAKASGAAPERKPHAKQSGLLKSLQELLSDILEIPINEIQADSALEDLGIDSLMITEVSGEVRKRLGINVSVSDFQESPDLRSLCRRLQPEASSEEDDDSGSITPVSSASVETLGYVEDSSSSSDADADADDDAAPGSLSRKNFAAVGKDCIESIRGTFDSFGETTNFMGFCKYVYPLQSELVVAYIVEAFDQLGCPLAPLSPGQKLPEIQYAANHRKVVNQIFTILEDAKLIDGKRLRTEKPVPQTSAEELHSAIIEKFPIHASEHKLLHSTGSKLADCLTGRTDPIPILFGNAQARALMTDVYTNAPMFKTGTIFLAQFLASTLRRYSPQQEIKILELGAGTGGTTAFLVDHLVASGQKFTYTFTDLSSSLVVAAKRRFAQHSFMRYTVLNIEEDPAEQYLGEYDIVISTNCIHATRNLTTSCTNIRKMLRPDGLLCLVELTRNLFWFDLVFGLLEGWWLFEDGRKHALAHEGLWDEYLRSAGFNWIDWSEGASDESRILRVIAASPSTELPVGRTASAAGSSITAPARQETVVFKEAEGLQLMADIYYPENLDDGTASRPVALMIHGGGHVMLSRKDIRPAQTRTLLAAGFLPISIDYRLCPETTLAAGPMVDVADALTWAQRTLPSISLARPDIRVDGKQTVAVGWSTGGTLAMTLAWTASSPPSAILAFYCPSDYEDPFWSAPNVPRGTEAEAARAHEFDLWEDVRAAPIVAYNPAPAAKAVGGWMSAADPRSRIALKMNWEGRALPVLLNGLQKQRAGEMPPEPSREQVVAVSPLAQARLGRYRVPTFVVHGTSDDLVPSEQAERTVQVMREEGVEAECRIVQGAVHLFDIYRDFEGNEEAKRAVQDGYAFLKEHVHIGGGRGFVY